MTNEMIILMESVKLMEAGLLKGSGKKAIVMDADGNEKELEAPEVIHTFAGWKNLGFSVKKGEHAVASFPIWSGKDKTVIDDETGEESKKTRLFLRKAYWFTADQVEATKDRPERKTRRRERVPALPAVPQMTSYGNWLADA